MNVLVIGAHPDDECIGAGGTIAKHIEKGDSVFNVDSSILLDLSGKKTDFRFDLVYKRQWNIVFSEKDEAQMEERLRFRRKYFKKVSASSNSRIARHNSKSIEIDENKIRWDLDNQLSINFPFSRKLSLNADWSGPCRFGRAGWLASAAIGRHRSDRTMRE